MRRDRNKNNKDITDDYLADRLDEDTAAGKQRFGKRSKHHSEMKTRRTHQRREKLQSGKLLKARVIEMHGLPSTMEIA